MREMEMEQLPPDQRAVLSLVLTRRKSYAEVASLLDISEQSVRERAHAALDALAAIPTAPATASSARPDAPATSAAAGVQGRPAANGSGGVPPTRRTQSRAGSRTGGAILLGGLLAAIVVAAILLSSGGGKGSGQAATHSTPGSNATSAGAGSNATSAGAGSGGVHLDKQLTLSPTDPSSRATGEGIVVSKGGRRAFYVKAHGLPPSSGFFYAVWLYNSSTESLPLGKTSVGSNGVLEGGGPLTATNLEGFHKLVITRETNNHPTSPGPIVMSASFSLH